MKINTALAIAIAQKYNLKLLYLFGSFANNTQQEKSDIDFAFLKQDNQPMEYKQYMQLQSDFCNTFKDAHREIQLVDLANAKSLLNYEIARTGKLIYGSPNDDFTFYNKAIKIYIDEKPLRDLRREKLISA